VTKLVRQPAKLKERVGEGGGDARPNSKPLHSSGNIEEHTRDLQLQGRFRGGRENQGPEGHTSGEGEVPKGLIFYPGETSPRSPPDSSGERQGEAGREQGDERVGALRRYVAIHARLAEILGEELLRLGKMPNTDPATLSRQERAFTFFASKYHGLEEALDILEGRETATPEWVTKYLGFTPRPRDLL
jgi:hypothetical protein